MARRPRVPESVCERAEEIASEYEYNSIGEAIRHVFREGGHDV